MKTAPKVRPLRKKYSKTHPYVVERQDQEDGAIHYEIWDYRPDTYRRLCTVCEDYNDDSDDGSPERGQAKKDADLIARALNLMNGGFGLTKEKAHLIAAAPDMLAALKATRLYVETLERVLDPTIDPGAPKIREHGAMLRAAIAKAEGTP